MVSVNELWVSSPMADDETQEQVNPTELVSDTMIERIGLG